MQLLSDHFCSGCLLISALAASSLFASVCSFLQRGCLLISAAESAQLIPKFVKGVTGPSQKLADCAVMQQLEQPMSMVHMSL